MKPVLFIVLIALLAACTCIDEEALSAQDETYSDEQLAFWDAIQTHCGNAYSGHLADATPYYAFEYETIKIHVRNCTDDLTHISLHIDDNHSRNLMLTKTGTNLRLKHDHRNMDGTEEEISQYGGDAGKPGLATRQHFWADDHTANILPLRFDNFWFLDIMDENTFAYGVHWPKHGHSIRIEFDTTTPVDPPPSSWGY